MPLPSIRPALVAAALLAAAPPLAAGEPAAELRSDHIDRPAKIVGIGPSRLFPSVLVVPPEASFGWLNYTSGDVKIEFADDITRKLSCRSPGPFRPKGRDAASPRIESGGFVTLCRLAPGEYDYRVEVAGSDQPLLGKLVIEGGT